MLVAETPCDNTRTFCHQLGYSSNVQELCRLLAPHLTTRILPVNKKVLATLWLLGNQESFRGVGDRFDLSKSSLHKVLLEAHNDYSCQDKRKRIMHLVWSTKCAPEEPATNIQGRNEVV
ncbi:hypothetical protein GWK47_015394 [Chionoecetes opilio]|uniref:Uncharacterized protein n=1 Tax=Chionoecetes opilio TaxID=41210 RepID=A0A8J4XVD7_CHIOP|nr:hypothetical protein GWK47_015394 [Chionoecetes opilio]